MKLYNSIEQTNLNKLKKYVEIQNLEDFMHGFKEKEFQAIYNNSKGYLFSLFTKESFCKRFSLYEKWFGEIEDYNFCDFKINQNNVSGQYAIDVLYQLHFQFCQADCCLSFFTDSSKNPFYNSLNIKVLDYSKVVSFYTLIQPVIKAPPLAKSIVINNNFTERIILQSIDKIHRMLDYISIRISEHYHIIKHRFIVTQSGKENLVLDIELNEEGDQLQLLFEEEHDKYLIDKISFG